MILYYTPNSPFARIARIGVREGGLSTRIEEREAILRRPENPVLGVSPLGRVPTLVDGGIGIADTGRIYACLADASGNPAMRLAPVTDRAALAFEALAVSVLESIVALRRELRRTQTEQSPAIVAQERERSDRALAEIERMAAQSRLPKLPAFAAVVLAVTLDYTTFTGLMPGWEERFPALAGWLVDASERASMVQTAPVPVG